MSIRGRNHLAEEERAGCFTLAVFLLSCDFWCSVSLPRGPCVGLQCVIMTFPGHAYLLFI